MWRSIRYFLFRFGVSIKLSGCVGVKVRNIFRNFWGEKSYRLFYKLKAHSNKLLTSSYMNESISSNGFPYMFWGNGSNFLGNKAPSSTDALVRGWKPYSRTNWICRFSCLICDRSVYATTWCFDPKMKLFFWC